jgi:PST family polysaccharide transporter
MRSIGPSPNIGDSRDLAGARYLVTDGSNLRARTRLAAAFGTASQVASAVIGLLSVALLSRTLSPDDVGLVAIAAVFLAVLYAVSESGFSYAAEQRDQISHAQVSNLFWANLALGCTAFAVACAISPAIATLYGRPELTGITAALGFVLLVSSISIQHAALLRRQLQFGRLALIVVSSRVVGLAVALVVAHRGGGYWALVTQELSGAIVRASGAWVLCSWRPAPPRRGSGAMPLIRLGVGRSLADVLGVVRRQVDGFFVGWFLGPESLGLYNRGVGLFAQPLSTAIAPLSSVALPALSRVQAESTRFRMAMREGIGSLACITLPVCGFVAVASENLVAIALGPGWHGVAPIMRAMVVGMSVTCLLWPAMSWGFSSRGLTALQARWAMLALAVAAAASAAGSSFGAVGAAWGMSISSCLTLPIGAIWALRGSGFGLGDLASVTFMPLVAAVGAGATGAVVLSLGESSHPVWTTVMSAVVFGLVYGGMFLSNSLGRSQLFQLVSIALWGRGQR